MDTQTQHTPEFQLCFMFNILKSKLVGQEVQWVNIPIGLGKVSGKAIMLNTEQEVEDMIKTIVSAPELKKEIIRLDTAVGEKCDEIQSLSLLNVELLKALKDVAATKSIIMKRSPSEVELKEMLATFERVNCAVAKAEDKDKLNS